MARPQLTSRRLAELSLAAPTKRASVSKAVAVRVGGKRESKNTNSIRPQLEKPEEWQREAYDLAEDVGEVGYILGRKGDAVALGTLVVGELKEDGSWLTCADESDFKDLWEKAERVLTFMQTPSGGHDDILRALSYHDDVAGEALFVGTILPDTDDQIVWEVLSNLEIVPSGGSEKTEVERKAKPTGGSKKLDDSYVSRYLRPDRRHSGLPTSTIKRALPILREIDGLSAMLAATINTRLNAGILVVASELQLSTTIDEDGDDDPDGEMELDTIEDRISNFYVEAIEDPSSGASSVPLILRGPHDIIQDGIKLFDVAKANEPWVSDQRDKALLRLARTLDIPQEIMTGLGATNHWSASALTEDMVNNHVIPAGQRYARFLTVAYLRVMMVAFEDVDPELADRFHIRYDSSNLIEPASRGQHALTLHERGLLADARLVEILGFDPEVDMPTEDETLHKALVQACVANPLMAAQLGIFRYLGVEIGADPAAPVLGAPTPDGAPDGGPGAAPERVRGDRPAERPDDTYTVSRMELVERIRGFADATIEQAVTRAASRVVNNAQRDPVLKARLRNVSKADVLSQVSIEELDQIGLPAQRLFDGAWEEFRVRCIRWTSELFVAEGTGQQDAAPLAWASIDVLVQDMDRLAQSARTARLTPGHGGTIVPQRMVVDALAYRAVPV